MAIIDVGIMERAGVKLANVAKLLGVSRPTLTRWQSGQSSPHPLRRARVEKVNELIERGISLGLLPVNNPDLNHNERSRRTVALLRLLQGGRM